MLRGIRKASSNWLGRAVMGVVMTLLAGSFAVWGINDIFRGYSTSYLAKIGSTEIAIDQFQQTYNDQLQRLSQQAGRPITPAQASAFGLDRQVLARMIIDAGLDQMSNRMRLGIPDSEIARHITADPHFQTPTGQFDRARFEDFLRGIGYTEARFVDEQRRTIPRHELTDAIAGELYVPRTILDAVNQFQNQQRTIQYLALGPAQAGDIPQPTDEELSKYFADRKILFRAPEYRKIVTVAVTPEQLAGSIEVSDADVKKTYEENIGSYTTPERRHVEQIVFPTMAEAQAASARIKSGVSFDTIATERKLKKTDYDLGTIAKNAIVDPAVANAAFSLKAGEVSAPIQGQFGAVIVTVLSIEAKEVKSLEVVAPFIRNDIALQRAKSKVQDIHDKIEDARAGGSTLEEAAKKLNLPLVTIDVDRSGRDPQGKLVTGVPNLAALVNAAYASDVGVDNDPLEVGSGYVWYDVAAITPARDRTLDEVKADVSQRWHNDEVAKRLKDKAAGMLEKLRTGTTLDALASAGGLKVQTAADLKRATASPGVPAKVIDATFHTVKDAYGSVDGDTPTQWFVFRVTEVKTPSLDANSADGKKLVSVLQQQMSDGILNQYVAWMEDYLGTTINQPALAQAVGNSTPE